MASHTRLTAEHCDLFNLPCYQFSQLRPYSAQAELPAHNKHEFLCIGRHLEREQLARHDTPAFIAATITELLPLYHAAHPILHANK